MQLINYSIICLLRCHRSKNYFASGDPHQWGDFDVGYRWGGGSWETRANMGIVLSGIGGGEEDDKDEE